MAQLTLFQVFSAEAPERVSSQATESVSTVKWVVQASVVCSAQLSEHDTPCGKISPVVVV